MLNVFFPQGGGSPPPPPPLDFPLQTKMTIVGKNEISATLAGPFLVHKLLGHRPPPPPSPPLSMGRIDSQYSSSAGPIPVTSDSSVHVSSQGGQGARDAVVKEPNRGTPHMARRVADRVVYSSTRTVRT